MDEIETVLFLMSDPIGVGVPLVSRLIEDDSTRLVALTELTVLAFILAELPLPAPL